MTPGQGLPRARLRTLSLCAACLCLAGTFLGCKVPGQMNVGDSSKPQYQRANVVYELDGTQRALPLTDPEVKTASLTGMNEVPVASPEWSGATLTLQYPHPDGIADTARATLRLTAEPARNSRSAVAQASRWLGWNKSVEGIEPLTQKDPHPLPDDEIWVLDIPKEQLDLLLTDLQQSGFFQAQTRSQTGTKLDVQLNWGRMQKEWSSEPRLDHFMSRVYREGRLEGLVARTPDHHNIYAVK